MIKWVRESTPKVLNSTLPAPQLNFDDKSKSATLTTTESKTKLSSASKRQVFCIFYVLMCLV